MLSDLFNEATNQVKALIEARLSDPTKIGANFAGASVNEFTFGSYHSRLNIYRNGRKDFEIDLADNTVDDVKNQTFNMYIEAVCIDGVALKYVRRQPPALISLALQNNPSASRYVDKQ